MSSHQEVTFTVELGIRRNPVAQPKGEAKGAIPRIARLLALAIRLDRLIREEVIRDYAEVAWRGRVTRARVTQIMKLLDLAPDLQEAILFLPSDQRLNERNLRPVLRAFDWEQQRRIFQQIASGS